MRLREGEGILKIYRRHLFPMVIKVIEIVFGGAFFYLLIYWLRNSLSATGLLILISIVTAIFLVLILHVIVDERLDNLVVTNQRIIFVDWKMLILKTESELDIKDIQEITFSSRGILSRFRMFNFGTCVIETASHALSIKFEHVSRPAEMRDFILNLKRI